MYVTVFFTDSELYTCTLHDGCSRGQRSYGKGLGHVLVDFDWSTAGVRDHLVAEVLVDQSLVVEVKDGEAVYVVSQTRLGVLAKGAVSPKGEQESHAGHTFSLPSNADRAILRMLGHLQDVHPDGRIQERCFDLQERKVGHVRRLAFHDDATNVVFEDNVVRVQLVGVRVSEEARQLLFRPVKRRTRRHNG